MLAYGFDKIAMEVQTCVEKSWHEKLVSPPLTDLMICGRHSNNFPEGGIKGFCRANPRTSYTNSQAVTVFNLVRGL
jgi:hypothetical protein